MENNEINQIFKEKELIDLKYFIKQRDSLNNTNILYIYGYHVINSSGIILTTVATYYDNKPCILAGITLNIVGQLLNTFVHLNNSISDRIYKNILRIKDNKYFGSTNLIDPDKDTLIKQSNSRSNTIDEKV